MPKLPRTCGQALFWGLGPLACYTMCPGAAVGQGRDEILFCCSRAHHNLSQHGQSEMGKAKQQNSTACRQDKGAATRKPEARTDFTASKPWSLSEYGLRVKAVKADGNCFFRACADQLEVCDLPTVAIRHKMWSKIHQYIM